MNELGMTLAWAAVQVTLVLAPGLIAYAMAARRGPAAGASVAALCLGLVVATSVGPFLPGLDVGREPRIEPVRAVEASPPVEAASPIPAGTAAPGRPGGNGPFAAWRVAWDRFGRGAEGPAARCRPWAGWLAALFLAGTAVGSLRLAIGLGAVVACRRRGRLVDDPDMTGLIDELRGAIGCRVSVELREVADLVGPAAAGWRRPVILLPEDWRCWDGSERRAVLGHELAHVVRGDYAAGLLARLAVALNAYHPIVRWMAGQLRLQQEMAADAIGADLAGGRAGYLVALSRLALRQDGRSPGWPARAFLPARGTLVRRIEMLRDETRTERAGRHWTRASRLATTAVLLGATAAVMALRGPARGGEEGRTRGEAGAPASGAADASLPPLYAHEGMSGVIAVRPAAVARHAAIGRLLPLLGLPPDLDPAVAAKKLRVDTSRPGFVTLGPGDIEWIALWVRFGRGGKDPQGVEMHRIEVSSPSVRTVAPFDWLAYLRQWRCEITEVREGGGVYYEIKSPLVDARLLDGYAYLPDDRTIVFEQEAIIRRLARGEAPPRPAFLRGPDWERACRGMLAYAVSNRDGALAKDYDLGRPGDAVVLSLLKGVDHWTFSVDDADALALRVAAACDGGEAGAAIARTVEALVKRGRAATDRAAEDVASGTFDERGFRMIRALCANARVERSDRRVDVHAEGFGSLADLVAVLESESRSIAAPETGKRAPKTPDR